MDENVIEIEATLEEDKKDIKEETVIEKAKRLSKTALDKVIGTARYLYSHPVETGAFVASIVAVNNKVVKPLRNGIEDRKQERLYYDRYGSCRHIECRRALSDFEAYAVDSRVRHGEVAYEVLREMGLLKR